MVSEKREREKKAQHRPGAPSGPKTCSREGRDRRVRPEANLARRLDDSRRCPPGAPASPHPPPDLCGPGTQPGAGGHPQHFGARARGRRLSLLTPGIAGRAGPARRPRSRGGSKQPRLRVSTDTGARGWSGARRQRGWQGCQPGEGTRGEPSVTRLASLSSSGQ